MKKILTLVLCLVLALSLFTFGGCKDDKTITVGASVTPHAEILRVAQKYLEEKGYTLNIVEYSDYVQPNLALSDGSLDANYFQHQPYLTKFCSEHNLKLTSVLRVHFEPLGLYQGKLGTTLSQLKAGDKIALPDDTTNCARALQLLAANGVIEIVNDKGLDTTVKDCNSKGLQLIPLEAGAIAVQLPELAFAVINGNYAVDFGLVDKVVASEDSSSQAYDGYANILVVRKGEENSAKTKALIYALSQQEVKDFITATYQGLVVPYFSK